MQTAGLDMIHLSLRSAEGIGPNHDGRVSLYALLLMTAGAFVCGCNRNTESPSRNTNVSSHTNLSTQGVRVLHSCRAAKDLEDFYAIESLGGRAEVQARNGLVFVQTFPYSGVRASHVYVYAQEGKELRFVAFLRAQTQKPVAIHLNNDGSVEVDVGDRRVVFGPKGP